MLERGVYVPPSGYEAWFLSAAHTDREVEFVLDAVATWRS
jgi:glutamate-1-semialdehyde 2,1-aminomutase